jgi:hypothetical protein
VTCAAVQQQRQQHQSLPGASLKTAHEWSGVVLARIGAHMFRKATKKEWCGTPAAAYTMYAWQAYISSAVGFSFLSPFITEMCSGACSAVCEVTCTAPCHCTSSRAADAATAVAAARHSLTKQCLLQHNHLVH